MKVKYYIFFQNEHTRAVNDVQDTLGDYQRTVSIAESAASASSLQSTERPFAESEVQVAGTLEKSNSFPRGQQRQNVSPQDQVDSC